jgi:hypothetical protein
VPERLPEFIWIEFTLKHLGPAVARETLEYLDGFCDYSAPKAVPITGTISSFETVPVSRRKEILSGLPSNINRALGKWKPIAKLYPAMPGSWLFLASEIPDVTDDLTQTLANLKEVVLDLYDRRSRPATLAKLLAISRLIIHGKLRTFDKGMIERFAGYPQEDEDARKMTEAEVASLSITLIHLSPISLDWPKYFWRNNIRISMCENANRSLVPEILETARYAIEQSRTIAQEFIRTQRILLLNSYNQSFVDLWDREREEVLWGLLSRQFQVVSILLEDISLWRPEAGSHLLRHLAENLITVRYLDRNPDLIKKFVEHGLGQLKLYKLHLQEEERSLDVEDAELSEAIDMLEAEIGGEVSEEWIAINLGSWSDTNLREMAKEVGLEETYKWVYQPQSIDAHGTWASIQSHSMNRCRNPLHRFHLVPHFGPSVAQFPIPFLALDLFEQLASEVAALLRLSTPLDTSPVALCRQGLKALFAEPLERGV